MLLRDLGMSAGTEWRALEKQLRDLDMDTSGALEQKERQRLFLEVRGELAAEQGFKSLLESAPEISAGTSWPLAKRQVCTNLYIENFLGFDAFWHMAKHHVIVLKA